MGEYLQQQLDEANEHFWEAQDNLQIARLARAAIMNAMKDDNE